MATAAVAPGPLLERDEFLSALQIAHEDARAGRGRALFVTGEAGVGKTALLRRFRAELAPEMRVLWGACEPLFTARPLGPILDVVQDAAPEIRDLVEGDPVPYQVAMALIRELQQNGPTMLVLEDVHWADEATLDVLRLLVRRVEALPVLLVSSYREEDVTPTHPLTLVLGETTSGLGKARLRLPPLSSAAVAELAGPFGLDPEALYRSTSGNPFFVTEVLASPGTEIPATVRDAVLARAARLSTDARGVLEAVAISSPKAEIWLVEALSGTSDHRLDECVGSGMLEVEEGAVGFRHELARAAVEESLAPARRLDLHRRALAALEAPPGGAPDFARLAHHADAAADGDAVLRLAPEAAARASALGAHREAAEHYARALRFSDRLGGPGVAELLRRRSTECYFTDQSDEAIDALRRAVSIYADAGDRLSQGVTLINLADILWCPGRGAEARETGAEGVALLEQLPPSCELAFAYTVLAFLHREAGDFGRAREWNRRALELAEELGDALTLCFALSSSGFSEIFTDFERGRRRLERAEALAIEVGDAGIVTGAIHGVAAGGVHWRRYELADAEIERGLEGCRESGHDLMALYFLQLQASSRLQQGLWQKAADSSAAVLRERTVSTFPRTMALVVLALVRARRGDPDVWPLLDEARELSEPTGELSRIVPVAVARGEVAWLTGRPEAVAAETDAAFELALELRAGRAIGELAVVRKRAGQEDTIPLDIPDPYALEVAGDWREAADCWQRFGCPYETALALADAGEEAPLRQALELCQQLGARPLANLVSRRLRALGVSVPRGPRPATRENPAQLTPREVDVLGLLAEGLRNAQMAERLVVSRRTVDFHVSSILRKLDAHTRGEAVAEARRVGLIQDR